MDVEWATVLVEMLDFLSLFAIGLAVIRMVAIFFETYFA
jgi:hypothetical protein